MLETTCPHCGRRNRHHMAVRAGAGPPTPGNVSLCIGCFRPAVYENGPAGLRLRLPSADELSTIEANPQYQRAVRKLRDRQPDRRPDSSPDGRGAAGRREVNC
ncbi:hypothetical protein [Pseudonocardia zijingensis]|uniref:Uncharacterized protein n=1 Tax=Pseudonocardia zijingensis TaxID=153376 RepID=A0ABN1PAI2_9PSEU